MSRKSPFAFLILSLFITAFCQTSWAYGQINQYENQIIEKIDIVVAIPSCNNFDADAVRLRIKTKEGDLFSQSEFDNDLKILAKDYDRVDTHFNSIEDRMYITLKIWPKPTIRSINWDGNEKLGTKRLQKELQITSAVVYDRQAFNKAFHTLKAYYIKKGFFEAQLDYNVRLDTLTNEVDIDIRIIEGRAGMIKEIKFVNFTREEEDTILDMMVTKKYNIFTSWFTSEGNYREDAVQQDQFVILNYLQNKGYADAQVEIEVCESQEKNRINVIIRATKGSIYHFGKIDIEGNTLFDKDVIMDLFAFVEGEPYSPDAIRTTTQNIMNFYGKRGYIDAFANFEPSLSCEECTYNVNFSIEEGEQFRVGLIKVFGNCSTQSSVILHECFLIPGEIFNLEKMQKTEERLQAINFFKNVNVYAVNTEEECELGENYRDVHIEVEETDTGQFGAFFGFSTVENFFGGLNITERNFNYKGLGRVWRDGFSVLRGGGEYLHGTTTIGSKSRSYVLSWTKPFFRDTQWTVGFDIERSSNRYIAKDYDIDSTGITFHAIREVNQFVRAGLHYRLKNTDIEIAGGLTKKEHEEHKEGKHGASLVKESKNDGIISAIGGSLTYDSTNHPVFPTDGIKSRGEIEFAGVGGHYKFFGASYLNTMYHSIGSKGVLKLRADFRFLFPLFGTSGPSLPLDERLFLGGDCLVRGYRPYKLGPRFIEGDPRGGLSLQFLSVEYDRKLINRFTGFLFCDAGHLSFREGNFGRLSVAVGYGLKVTIFESAPPVNVGMGYPLNPRNRGEVKKFFLTIGGRF